MASHSVPPWNQRSKSMRRPRVSRLTRNPCGVKSGQTEQELTNQSFPAGLAGTVALLAHTLRVSVNRGTVWCPRQPGCLCTHCFGLSGAHLTRFRVWVFSRTAHTVSVSGFQAHSPHGFVFGFSGALLTRFRFRVFRRTRPGWSGGSRRTAVTTPI